MTPVESPLLRTSAALAITLLVGCAPEIPEIETGTAGGGARRAQRRSAGTTRHRRHDRQRGHGPAAAGTTGGAGTSGRRRQHRRRRHARAAAGNTGGTGAAGTTGAAAARHGQRRPGGIDRWQRARRLRRGAARGRGGTGGGSAGRGGTGGGNAGRGGTAAPARERRRRSARAAAAAAELQPLPHERRPCRILPVGDSITFGINYEGCVAPPGVPQSGDGGAEDHLHGHAAERAHDDRQHAVSEALRGDQRDHHRRHLEQLTSNNTLTRQPVGHHHGAHRHQRHVQQPQRLAGLASATCSTSSSPVCPTRSSWWPRSFRSPTRPSTTR